MTDIRNPGRYAGRTFSDQLTINASEATFEGCTFDGAVTQPGEGSAAVIVASTSRDVRFINCTWRGYSRHGLLSRGTNVQVENCMIAGTPIQEFLSFGIRAVRMAGYFRVTNCRIEDTGGHGIYVDTETQRGDVVEIANNTIRRCGQAGIAFWRARGSDGVGGKALVRANEVSECNLGAGKAGYEDGTGTYGACGIHVNDGVASARNPGKPLMKIEIIGNRVHSCLAPARPDHPDSGGIALDFGARGVLVVSNACFGNAGAGIYIYNGSENVVSGNICSGNDAGILCSSSGGAETAVDNLIENNLLGGNFNGNRGPGNNCEILVFRTAGTRLLCNRYLPLVRGIWDMGENLGFIQSGNVDIRGPAAKPLPITVEGVVKQGDEVLGHLVMIQKVLEA